MSKFKDITGQRFGRLTVLYRLHNIKGKTKWFCVCDCGNLKEVTLSDLKKGNTQSCGCLYKDIHTKHKKCDTRLYCIFGAVKSRCYNKITNVTKIMADVELLFVMNGKTIL